MSAIKKRIGEFEYSVFWQKPDEIFHFPRGKKEKLKLLRFQFFNRLDKYWKTLPKYQAVLEREYFKELFDQFENE